MLRLNTHNVVFPISVYISFLNLILYLNLSNNNLGLLDFFEASLENLPFIFYNHTLFLASALASPRQRSSFKQRGLTKLNRTKAEGYQNINMLKVKNILNRKSDLKGLTNTIQNHVKTKEIGGLLQYFSGGCSSPICRTAQSWDLKHVGTNFRLCLLFHTLG